ncbi:MAG TPA: ScyD/ScyE family protein [Candidatus Dormibacteraeota bacterium]
MHRRSRYLFGLLATALVVALLPSPAAAAPNVSLVATGLDSPRGIAFVGRSAVVAEAGHGSDNPADCFPGGFGNICIGNTSQISWVNTATGAHSVLAKGFFSISLGQEGTIGVSGLSVRGGKIYAQIGATGREVPPQFAIGEQAGNLISVNPKNGSWMTVAKVGNNDFDYTTQFTPPDPATCGQCPGSQEHDANPNDVVATSNGLFVADSGANTLTKVGKDGKTEVLFHFTWRDPNFMDFPSDEVPTCLTNSGGAWWIGTLAGHLFRFADGNATLVSPKDASGKSLLSHVTGCTSRGGNLYLVNMFGAGQMSDPTFVNGSVVKFNPESGKGSVLVDAFHNPFVFLPYMAKFGPDGNLYVTTGAVCPANGANPFGGGPNPCTIGEKKGGRVVRISIGEGEND